MSEIGQTTEIKEEEEQQLQPVESQQPEESPKKVIERRITMYGHLVDSEEDNACGNCQKVDDTVNTKVIPGSNIPVKYEHHDVYTDEEGKRVVEEKNLDRIPYTEDCSIYNDGSKDCRELEGWNPSHWKESRRTESFENQKVKKN